MRVLSILIGYLSLFPVTPFAQECITHTDSKDAVYGEAAFIGEPWTFTWHTFADWDNERGEWVTLPTPREHAMPIPGEAILVHFEDGTEFVYTGGDTDIARADNLFTLSHYGYGDESGPYEAMRTADGRILLLDEEKCEPVSWDLTRQ